MVYFRLWFGGYITGKPRWSYLTSLHLNQYFLSMMTCSVFSSPFFCKKGNGTLHSSPAKAYLLTLELNVCVGRGGVPMYSTFFFSSINWTDKRRPAPERRLEYCILKYLLWVNKEFESVLTTGVIYIHLYLPFLSQFLLKQMTKHERL